MLPLLDLLSFAWEKSILDIQQPLQPYHPRGFLILAFPIERMKLHIEGNTRRGKFKKKYFIMGGAELLNNRNDPWEWDTAELPWSSWVLVGDEIKGWWPGLHCFHSCCLGLRVSITSSAWLPEKMYSYSCRRTERRKQTNKQSGCFLVSPASVHRLNLRNLFAWILTSNISSIQQWWELPVRGQF